eukprot:scaffold5105_cov39-Attheya_sp.AAC.1
MLRKGLCIATGGGQSGPGGEYTFEDSSDDDKPKMLPASHVSHATKPSTIVSSMANGGANAGIGAEHHKKEKKGSWRVGKSKKSKKKSKNPRPDHPLSADVAEDSDIPLHIDFFASQESHESERLDMSSLLQTEDEQQQQQQHHTHLTTALGDDPPPGAPGGVGVGDLFEDWTMDVLDSMPDEPPPPTLKQKARKSKAKSSSSVTDRSITGRSITEPPPPPPQAAAAVAPKRIEKAPAPKPSPKPRPKSSGSSILSRTKMFGSKRLLGNAPVESDSDDDSVYSDNVVHSVSDSISDDGGMSMGSGRNLLEEVDDDEYDEKYMEQGSDSEEESDDDDDGSDDDSDDGNMSLLSSLSRTNAVRRSGGTDGGLAKKTAAYASLLRQEPWEQNAKKKTTDASENAQDLNLSLARLDESIAKAGTSHFRDVVEDWNTSDSSDIDTNKSTATGVLNDDSTTGSIAEPPTVPAANLLTIVESEDKFREQSEQKKEYDERIKALDKELSEERERNAQGQKELQTAKGILSIKEKELEAARSSPNKRNATQANLGAAGRNTNDVGVDDSYVEKIGALKVQLYKSEFESRKIKKDFQKKAKEHETAMALLVKESKENERQVLDIEKELALAKVAAVGVQALHSSNNVSQSDPEAAEAAEREWKKKEAVYHTEVQQLTHDLEEAQKKNILFQKEWERRLADTKTKAEAEADLLMAQEATLSKQVATMTQEMEDRQRKSLLQVKQLEQEVAIAQTESQAEADKRVRQESIQKQKLELVDRDLEETKRALLLQVRDLENKLANTKAEALAQADNHTAQEAFYAQQVISMSKELKSVKSASENGVHQSNALGNGNAPPRSVSNRVRQLEQQLGSAKEKAHVEKFAADIERDAIHKRKTEALSIELEETRNSSSIQVKSLQKELEMAKSQAAANKKAAAEKEIYEKNYDMLGQELEETKSALSLEVKELKKKLDRAQSKADQRVIDAENKKTDALRKEMEESRSSLSLEVHELQKQLANAKWEAKTDAEKQAMVYQDKNEALSRELEETKNSLSLQESDHGLQLASAKEKADAEKRAVETEKESLYETKVMTMSQHLKKTESVLNLQVEDLQQQLVVSKTEAEAEARALDAEKEAMYEKK